MSTQIIKVPDIGGTEGVDVIEICVEVGDQVVEEDSLVVLESDKASMEIPSPYTGTVIAINVSDGDSLEEGDSILELEVDSAETSGEQDDNESPSGTASANNSSPETPTPESDNLSANNTPDTSSNVSEPAASVVADSVVEVVNIPDIGDDGADVIEVCITVGDSINKGDSLIVLETDKASMEVPAPKPGKVLSIMINEGDKATTGAAILKMEVTAPLLTDVASAPLEKPEALAAPEQEPAALQEPVATQQQPEPVAQVDVGPKQNNGSDIPAPAFATLEVPAAKPKPAEKKINAPSFYAGPAVRKLARELGVDLRAVKGSGPRGRIAKNDLKAHVKNTLQRKNTTTQGSGIPPLPEVDFSAFGDVELEPLSKIQKITADNMHRNWLNIPHVTQFDEADITDMEEFRQSLKREAESRNTKITPLPFLLKACALILKHHPKFNASLHTDGKHLVFKHYVHIGVAVDTSAGLLVPVVRDVDKKSVWVLAKESAELAALAKERKLKPAQMQGGCFTVSSLGGIGGQGFTPIVNAPEVAILGVSKLAVKPVWNGSEFEPKKMLPLALSYDHRAINGVDGGKFLTELVYLLSDIRRLVL